MLGFIPSPSTNGFNIGPLRLHAYGFLIVLGVFASVWLADRRWRAWGGEQGTFSNIAVWAVPGGLIGARLYSVITDYELYIHNPIGALEVWKGGLGIWGGIAGGAFAAWLYVRRHDLNWVACADAVAPALPLAQAIGRFGNYFNQELFGRPTSLPWGLKINPSIVANLFSNVNKPVPAAYLSAKAFQPTFLYESIWDIAVVFLVLWAEKHIRLRKGYLFWVYVALYTFGRFFTEYLRIDFAHTILGLRLNDWTSILVFALAMILLLRRGFLRRDDVPAEERRLDRTPVAVAAGQSGPTTLPGGDTLDDDGIGAAIAGRVGSQATQAEGDVKPFMVESPAAADRAPTVEAAGPEATAPDAADEPASTDGAEDPAVEAVEPTATEPEPGAATQPEVAAAAPKPEPGPEVAPAEPEPVVATAEPEPEPGPEVAPAEPEPVVATAESETAAPEPEVAAVEAESPAAVEAGRDVPAEPEPGPIAAEPQPPPGAAAPDPEPAAEPEAADPAVAEAAEPATAEDEDAHVAAGDEPEPGAAEPRSS